MTYLIPIWQDRPNKALLTDFCESTFKHSDLSKGNAWIPQVAMHPLYSIEAKKALKDAGRARITRRQSLGTCLTYAVRGMPPLRKRWMHKLKWSAPRPTAPPAIEKRRSETTLHGITLSD